MAKKKSGNSAKSAHTQPNQAPSFNAAAEAIAQGKAIDAGGRAFANKSVAKPAAKSSLLALPLELGRGDWTVIILALMMFLTPTLGVPHELMLQDTLKSIIVAFMSLGALFLVFWSQLRRREALRWHAVMWIPLALCAYALGSMVWSHTYLGGVEAIRWFLFAIIVWLVLNSVNRERFPMLAWGIHWGALGVAVLGASQFWFDVRLIPQGPNPAATFVNRNFAAEFMVCTLPFSAYLIFSQKRNAVLAFLAATAGLHLVFLLMCGTRSALVAAAAALLFIGVMAWRFRSQFSFKQWSGSQRMLVLGVLVTTIVGLGFIKSGNPTEALKDLNAFQRGFSRAASIAKGAEDGTLGVRMVMWKATAEIIKRRPLTGVGAGAWEVDIPLYQAEGSQLETDYYAHNEPLQLLGEYGLVGWLVMLGLIAYSLKAAWRTFANTSAEGAIEGPIRAVALTSLLALMVVSNIGFPWRLAATGAIFAICLGLLAASDVRMGVRGLLSGTRLEWSPLKSQIGAIATIMCLALAAYISQQAAESEAKIVNAVKMALSITQSGDPNNPRNDKTKKLMLQTLRDGVDINPHYRKITPMVGDELAKWGDWTNAIWVWESVVGSRPYVVAMMSNIARGYSAIGKPEKALEFLERCKKIQPKAVSVRSLEVILLSRTGKEAEAFKLAKQYVADNTVDTDLLNSGYILGIRASDFAFAIASLEKRNQLYPDQKVDGLLKIGGIYANYVKEETQALQAYKAAMDASNKSPAVFTQIPPAYQAKL